jgi:flagellar biogenesis protein FliO
MATHRAAVLVRSLLAGLTLATTSVAWLNPAWADYPEFPPTGHQPPPWPVQNAAYAEAGEPPQAASAAGPVDASEQAPFRYTPPASGIAEAPARLVAGAEDLPRPVGEARPELPLAPPGAEAKKGWRAEMSPALSAAASLGIVLGLFLLVVLVVRRGMPRGGVALPRDAVQLLGRAPLVGRQQLLLVRCGNKLLLLSVSATSATTLTEITDPAEVERLLELCEGSGPNASSFRQVLGQFTRQREATFVPHRHPDAVDFTHLDAYAHENVRGGRA